MISTGRIKGAEVDQWKKSANCYANVNERKRDRHRIFWPEKEILSLNLGWWISFGVWTCGSIIIFRSGETTSLKFLGIFLHRRGDKVRVDFRIWIISRFNAQDRRFLLYGVAPTLFQRSIFNLTYRCSRLLITLKDQLNENKWTLGLHARMQRFWARKKSCCEESSRKFHDQIHF